MNDKQNAEKQNAETTYLANLKFDPKLWTGWVAAYITNFRIVILLIIAILGFGLVGYFNLARRVNPEIKIPIIIVTTVLPGASPQEVESLLTIPIENELRSLKGLDTISSTSRENVSSITIKFISGITQDEAKADVQATIDAINNLPEDATTPKVVALDFEDIPIWTFSVSTDAKRPDLMAFANALKAKLDNVSVIDRVQTSGLEKQEVAITLKPEKLKEYNISPINLSQAIKSLRLAYPAGTLQVGESSMSLAIDPKIEKIDDIRKVRLTIAGQTFALGDIAEVAYKVKPNQTLSYLASQEMSPRQVVTFYIYKTGSVNVDQANNKVHSVVDDMVKQYGGRFRIETISNYAKLVEDNFAKLVGEITSTVLLVFVCLLVFLGLRQALIASFTVPLTFLTTFGIMHVIGMSLNNISVFAFLIALGLLVDDAIVVVQAMTTYFKTGKFSPQETGLLVWRDTIVPIWSTTITTIWSFVPLLLSGGIIGEFIKGIPIVVTSTMISSTAIAVLITLPLMIVLLRLQVPKRVTILFKLLFLVISSTILFVFVSGSGLFLLAIFALIVYLTILWLLPSLSSSFASWLKEQHNNKTLIGKVIKTTDHIFNRGIINLESAGQVYHRFILRVLGSKSLRRKIIAIVVIYALFSVSMLPLGFVRREFFPKTDTDQIYINLTMPNGTNNDVVEQEGLNLLEQIRQTEHVKFVSLEVGRSYNGTRGFGGDVPSGAMFTLHLLPEHDRQVKSMEIAERLRKKFKHYQKGEISVLEQGGGPPAGADLQISFLGDDLGKLDRYAQEAILFLKKQDGVVNAEKNIKPGTSKLVFVPNLTRVEETGLSVGQIGMWLRLYASGFSLDDIAFDKTSTEKTNIILRMGSGVENSANLSAIEIPTTKGKSYPLLSLGSLELRSNPTSIYREGGKRIITVTANVSKGFSSVELGNNLRKFAQKMKLATDYEWKIGGLNEENQKSVFSIIQAMGLAFLLIMVTMVLQFGSYRQAAIVLMVIPLAVSSVFLAFALMGIPLSFPALIGVLALFGIVVTNSMFIVDKINVNRREGMPLKEAIADAGSSRLEPIILTKLTTVLGLLPISIANPMWTGLGGAIISGLSISSTIMLLFIPAVYYEWFNDKAHTEGI